MELLGDLAAAGRDRLCGLHGTGRVGCVAVALLAAALALFAWHRQLRARLAPAAGRSSIGKTPLAAKTNVEEMPGASAAA